MTVTPDWTAVNYMFIQIDETASSSILIDGYFLLSAGEDEGKVPTINDEDYIEGNMIESPDYDNSGVFEAATDTEISRGVSQNAAFNYLTVPAHSPYARGEINNYRKLSGQAISVNDAVFITDGTGGITTGTLYQSDNNNTTNELSKFSGFWTSTAATGANTPGAVSRGIVGGFSSLTVGVYYYLDSTSGDITATPPAPGVGARICVGRAISATEIDTFDREQVGFFCDNVAFNLPAIGNTADTQIVTYFKPLFAELEGWLKICDAAGALCAKSVGTVQYDLTAGAIVKATTVEGDHGTSPSFTDYTNTTTDPCFLVEPSAGANRSSLSIELASSDNTSVTFTVNNVITNGTGSVSGDDVILTVKVWGYTV